MDYTTVNHRVEYMPVRSDETMMFVATRGSASCNCTSTVYRMTWIDELNKEC